MMVRLRNWIIGNCSDEMSKKMDLYIGCDSVQFCQHIARQFKEGMSFYDRSTWNFDHIKSVKHFNQLDMSDFFHCWHYSNFQPLWNEENKSKGTYDTYVPRIMTDPDM